MENLSNQKTFKKMFSASIITVIFPGLLILIPQITSAASFSDVPATDPNYAAIEGLKSAGILKGYDDGTFRPAQSVNRAEALKMIMSGAGYVIPKGFYATGYTDVGIGEWFSGYVMYGTTKGIINGNPDGTFAPTRTVNKAEFLKMQAKAFETNLSAYQNPTEPVSADSSLTDWYIPYLNYAKTINLISPDTDHNLHPSQNLNRGDCAEILYKTYILENGEDTQKLLSLSESKLVDSVTQISANNLEAAVKYSNEAIFFSSVALSRGPSLDITQSAYKISLSFQKLYAAYQAGRENRTDDLVSLVGDSKALALEAANLNSATRPLADKINNLGNNLLSQVKAN